jgi:hypothetical protein
MHLSAGLLLERHFQMNNNYDITNDLNGNEPYTTVQRVIDVIFNFLTAVGVIAAAGIAGYFYARFV